MPLLLASWNVAGWETTLKYIREHYGSLEAYLDRHQIDILCLQEVKVTQQKLSAERVPAGRQHSLAAHSVPGWDSFWACSKNGFNGVTTFARKGLAVLGSATPFRDESFDSEARCLRTDHGAFVLFNVYAHSTGEDPALFNIPRGGRHAEPAYPLRVIAHDVRSFHPGQARTRTARSSSASWPSSRPSRHGWRR
jgi:exonuclease III